MEQGNFQKFLPGFHSLQTNSFPCRKSPGQAARSLPKPLDSAYRLAYYKQGAAAVAGFKNQIDSGRQGYLRDTDCCRAAVETLSDGQQGMSNPRHSLIQYHRPEMLKLERWHEIGVYYTRASVRHACFLFLQVSCKQSEVSIPWTAAVEVPANPTMS